MQTGTWNPTCRDKDRDRQTGQDSSSNPPLVMTLQAIPRRVVSSASSREDHLRYRLIRCLRCQSMG